MKYKTEKHDYEKILKSLKIDNGFYRKKQKSLNKNEVFTIVSEFLKGSVGLGVGSGLTVSGLAPVGIMWASSISLLFSISTLITNGYFSKLKKRYLKLRNWIIVNTLLNEKILKNSMVDKKFDQKEAEELKKIYNHYFDKRKEIMKNTQFRVEDIFGDIINKDKNSQDQMIKLNNFSAKMMWIQI